MENPRPEKVAVVEEVREKLTSTEAVVFTEYRGLTVRDLQDLRGALSEAGGEYKVYKNTLVRRATSEIGLDLGDTLTGPTALAFVGQKADGTPGDAVLVAKALKAFATGNPNLVVKGGRLGEQTLDAAGVIALADVAPREELLARLAGGLAAPMTGMARLLQALPQKMAYALSALIEAGGAEGAPGVEQAPAADATATDATDTTDTDTTDTDTTDTEPTETQPEQDESPAEAAGETGDAGDDTGDDADEE